MSSNKTREITPVERFDDLLDFLNDLYQERDKNGIYPELENSINNMENIVRKNKEIIKKLISNGEINNKRYIEIFKNIRNVRLDKGKTRANGRASRRARGGMKRTYGNRTPKKTGLSPQQKKTKTIKRTRNHKKRYPKTGNRTRKLVIAKGMKQLEKDMAMMHLEPISPSTGAHTKVPMTNSNMIRQLDFNNEKRKLKLGGKRRKSKRKRKTRRKRRTRK